MRVPIFSLGELLIQFPVVLCEAVLEVFWPNGATRKCYILKLLPPLFLRHLTGKILSLTQPGTVYMR